MYDKKDVKTRKKGTLEYQEYPYFTFAPWQAATTLLACSGSSSLSGTCHLD